LRELNFEDQVVSVHLDVAETDAKDLLARSNLDAAAQKSVLTLRGLHIERETYQSLSDAGLLPPIATRTLMEEIDTEIEEEEAGGVRVDAARRAALPWYGRLHRWLLNRLPPPLGEDLAEVAYIEVSARRLAARKAVDELELFKTLPSVDEHTVDDAKRTFAHWEESAGKRLETLGADVPVDRTIMHRRQAKALTRIAVVEALHDLVAAGVISQAVAEAAATRVSGEVDQAGT
jgi:CPA1 family monovalent cation:H+ antiporter